MILHDHSDGDLVFFQVHLGGDRNFCYLLGDRAAGDGAVVDPGYEPDARPPLALEHGLTIRRILVTHGHGDHVGGLGRLVELTGATVHAGPGEEVPGAATVADGERLALGGLEIEALVTPGHTGGHVCWRLADRLLTGDLLFCGKVGGTGPYFPGSSAEREWASLRRLLELPDGVLVFPGHDYYGGAGERPHSTIGHERAHNPFLTCPDFDAFARLKENWAAYKQEHGIR